VSGVRRGRTAALGSCGERAAADFLVARGYHILERNF